MGFFKKLGGFFSSQPSNEEVSYFIRVKCSRCGEVINARINLYNDLSLEYDGAGNISGYICHKGIVGDGHCYQTIDIRLTFDPKRKLVDKQISGGQFVEDAG